MKEISQWKILIIHSPKLCSTKLASTPPPSILGLKRNLFFMGGRGVEFNFEGRGTFPQYNYIPSTKGNFFYI